ncbi:hypothetical protein NGTWS0302_14260 [Mycolicibacterium cyprinidarum]|uniref:Helix-turn-helix domain-containing protein n=1 Tax=Mycolicibacterium cyprinidarum TaxID=2860311 RepID=A0ABQ4V431_9MYCO|nr:hypothetical protein NGTWS1702_04120 [Mycolicibacterium sp. NGTWSNA01]GJF17484.1 hypothetical protein NGTWS0302_14260 [Mycolicibacterium sp. NGTWS0302]
MPHNDTRPVRESVHTAAARGRVCARTVERAIAAGVLPAFKVGRAVRLRRADVDAWLTSEPVQPIPDVRHFRLSEGDDTPRAAPPAAANPAA